MSRRPFSPVWRGPEWMTTKEAAQYLGLAPATVQHLTDQHALTDGRFGLPRPSYGSRYFRGKDVARYEFCRSAQAHIRPIVEAIRRYALVRGVVLPHMNLSFSCPLAALDHLEGRRFFAHAFHHDWVGHHGICVVPELALEAMPTIAGVVLHEVGHVMVDDKIELSAEPAADTWVRDVLGLEVKYSPKSTVQYLDRATLRKLGLFG